MIQKALTRKRREFRRNIKTQTANINKQTNCKPQSKRVLANSSGPPFIEAKAIILTKNLVQTIQDQTLRAKKAVICTIDSDFEL